MQWTRARLLGLFFAVTFGIGWVVPLVIAMSGVHMGRGVGVATMVFSSFAPLLGALVVRGPVLRGDVLEPLGISPRWNRFWLVAWVAPVLVLAVGVLFTWLASGVHPVLDVATLVANKRSLEPADRLADFDRYVRAHPHPSPLSLVLLGLPAGLTINFIPAFAEEIGWRGFLFRELPGSFMTRSLGIGLAQALFWLPMIVLGDLHPGHVGEGVLLLFALYLALSPSLTYFRMRGASVVPVALFRGTFVAMIPVANDLSFGTSDLLRPMYGVSAIIGALVLFTVLAVHDRFFATHSILGQPAPRSA